MWSAILQYANDAIFAVDLSGKIIHCNISAEKFYEYGAEELAGKQYNILLSDIRQKEFESIRDSLLFGEQPVPFETERITKTKNGLKISAAYAAIRDNAGKITGISVIERKIMLRRTMESKAQALLETAPDAMVIVNSFGQIILINAQTEKLFGYEKNELLGQDVEILIPVRFIGKHAGHRKHFFSNAKTRTMGEGQELFGKHKNGEEFPVEISLSPLETEDGILVSAAIRDISEKKKLENQIREINVNLEKKVQQRTAELETKNKELEQFAYVASHDLQEPLRTISSFVGFLSEEYHGKLDDNADSYLTYISQASERMQTLIKDLLDYSRIGRKIILQEVNCNAILSDVLADLSSAIEETGAKISAPEELLIVGGYATELKQLFQNLISNSIKFHREGVPPVIVITCKNNAGAWEFSFRDNGIGIEEQHHERIFIIFQRLHNRLEYEGSGIGLSHCKKIVELHGGKIWVDSQLGKGSNFQFTILKMEKNETN
jgi:PAS domain S-box-containing protein